MATATLTAATVTTTVPAALRPERNRLAEDLLAVAWEPGAAPPREVRVRPELLARLGPAVPGGLLGDPAGVPVVVDAALPRSPGFEVRRVLPR
jgi:hypothetical protein